ncbi:MAG TPA: hypothetical protein VGJ02_01710 [Pyrinomonadaceae bacterium]
MKRILVIAFVMIVAAFAGGGQTRLLATKTAPKSVQAILYYPNNPQPEVIDLPVEYKVPVENWDWSVKDGCLQYRLGKDETTFCGTFKIVRTYE